MSQRGELTRMSRAGNALRIPGGLFNPIKSSRREPDFASANYETRFRKGRTAWGLLLNGEDGNDLVEYAIVFIFFISMLLGIVDFGRALYTYHFVSNAAREATRWAAVRGKTCTNDGSCAAPATPSDIQTYVANITPPGVGTVSTTPTWPGTGPTFCQTTSNYPGCIVEVQVSSNFTFVVPLIRTTPLKLSSTSEMIIVH